MQRYLNKNESIAVATIQELQYFIRENINEAYPEPEAGAIAQLVLEHVLHKSRLQLSLQQQDTVTQAQEEEVKKAVVRLQRQEPVQYVLGVAHFYGLELQVDDRVLIPRPETEELVDRVIKQHQGREGLQVLDICTGSGCIPLTLAANLRASKVLGLEISADALEVAKANSVKLNLPVEWLQQDVFESIKGVAPDSIDIITSNPPYVREDEKKQMRENVLQFEPHLALFVPNADPLKYYKRIAAIGQELLKKDGKLYFEINEQYGAQVAKLLLEHGYRKAEVVRDLFEKDRMVEAVK